MSMLVVAKAVVPLEVVKVMFVFFLERVIVEECGCKLFCNLLYWFPVSWAEVGAKPEAALQE